MTDWHYEGINVFISDGQVPFPPYSVSRFCIGAFSWGVYGAAEADIWGFEAAGGVTVLISASRRLYAWHQTGLHIRPLQISGLDDAGCPSLYASPWIPAFSRISLGNANRLCESAAIVCTVDLNHSIAAVSSFYFVQCVRHCLCCRIICRVHYFSSACSWLLFLLKLRIPTRFIYALRREHANVYLLRANEFYPLH